jgi:hypothetical protein
LKNVFFALVLCLSFTALSQDLNLSDYNWNIVDVKSKGLSKEILFTKMDRDFVNVKSSICSNRAHMWAHDFKRFYLLDTGKIFLFYTKKKGSASLRTWWYHVAPVVNEGGKIWVMDAGFPGFIRGPLTQNEWFSKFADSTNCKEIQAHEKDLIERMFSQQTFPHRTAYGYYDCYYRIVPHTMWTPGVVAENLLGVDSEGRPVRTERPEIDMDELYQACIEATSTKIGFALGANKKKCKELTGRE